MATLREFMSEKHYITRWEVAKIGLIGITTGSILGIMIAIAAMV